MAQPQPLHDQVDDQGSPVTWGEHVTDDEYNAAPAS
jgi:hypothetical protein